MRPRLRQRPLCSAHASVLAATCALLAVACSPTLPPAEPKSDHEPAKLEIEAPRGAEIQVDRVFVGVAPLKEPVNAEPGRHRVVVTLAGHEPSVTDVDLAGGVTTTLDADLEETAQRMGSWAAIGAGGAGIATGVVLGVLAVVEQRKALDLPSADDPAYEPAIAARDRYRTGAGVAAGTGLGLLVVGALLFALDEVPAPKEPTRPGTVTVGAQPWLGPDGAGVGAVVNF